MTRLLARFVQDESGATAIEYAMITVIVALGIIVSLTSLRDGLIAAFGYVAAGFPN
jgi:pilus assembly protein Flp/PilA